jgi:WD40 repeat protein
VTNDTLQVFTATKKGDVSVWDGRGDVFFKLFEIKDTDTEGRVSIIVCMSLHPTMKLLFLGLGDGDIRVYRFTLYDGFRCAATLKFHTTRVTALTLSTNAANLLSGGVDCSLAVWTVPDEMLELPMQGFNDAGGEGLEGLEDAGHLMQPGVTVAESVAVSAVCFSSDGARFAAAFDDGFIKLYLSETGEFVLKLGPHNAAVNGLQFAPSGKFVVSASGDCTTKFWSVGVQDTDDVYTGHKNTRVLHLSYSVEGAEVASAAIDGSIFLWSAKRGTEMAAFEGHSDEVTGIVISSKDQTIITQCAIDGTVRRWSTLSGSELRDKRTSTIFVCSFAQSVSGDYVVSGGFDGSLSVWRVTDGKAHMRLGVEVTELDGVFLEKVGSVHNDAISCCCWSPNDDRIASGSFDGSVKVWNAQWANCTHTFDPKIGHEGCVTRLQFHQSGRFLCSSGTEVRCNICRRQAAKLQTANLQICKH